jgi:hypothetical protein
VDLPENFANYIWLENPPNCEHDPSIILHKVLPSPAFTSLKQLSISYIPMLSEIPDTISLLSSLEYLKLVAIAIRSLPETIKYLPKLLQLSVYDCQMLQSIPALSLNLIDFTVSNCESLETVLSSMGEPYNHKPKLCTVFLLNCKKLDSHSYHRVLKDAIAGIELGANEENDTIQYLLPVMPGIEYWYDYSSTQVSFTIELLLICLVLPTTWFFLKVMCEMVYVFDVSATWTIFQVKGSV